MTKRKIIYKFYFLIILLTISFVGGYSTINTKWLVLPQKTTLILSIIIFLVSLFYIIQNYLDLSESNYSKTRNFWNDNNKKDDNENSKSSIDIMFQLLDDHNDKNKYEEFKTKLFNSIEQKFFQEFPFTISASIILEELFEIEGNIRKQIKRLIYNSNLNLTIGIVINSIGIITLTVAIYTFDSTTSDVINYFIPRITIVLFFQIFSFFFLKLYKECLIDIKFFENEITNIKFKISSIKMAIYQNDTELVTEILRKFSDGNKLASSVIKTDETSEDLERLKSDKNIIESLSLTLNEIVKKTNKS